MSEVLAPVDTPLRTDRITWSFGAGEVRGGAPGAPPGRVV
jgi:hypothetical protein